MNGDASKAASHGASFPHDVIEQRLSVPFEYTVHFSRDVFHPDHPLLESVLLRKAQTRPQRVIIFVDSGVAGRLRSCETRQIHASWRPGTGSADHRSPQVHLSRIGEGAAIGTCHRAVTGRA